MISDTLREELLRIQDELEEYTLENSTQEEREQTLLRWITLLVESGAPLELRHEPGPVGFRMAGEDPEALKRWFRDNGLGDGLDDA